MVDFTIGPHLNADYFPVAVDMRTMELATKLDYPLHAIDDETSIEVVDVETDVVSKGEWRLFDHTS